MRIIFSIEYHTRWGQQLFLSGEIGPLGEGRRESALPMRYVDDGQWMVTIDVDDGVTFSYGYLVRENGLWRTEWGGHNFRPVAGVSSYRICDSWMNIGKNHVFFSSAIQQSGIFRRPSAAGNPALNEKKGIRFDIAAPALLPEESLALVGSFSENPWQVQSACLMSDEHYPLWSVTLPSNFLTSPFEYKFVIVDRKTSRIIAWEEGENRRFSPCPLASDEVMIVDCGDLRIFRPLCRFAGSAIPVFSLRSHSSWGIGEFLDLKKMVDWVVLTGQRFIQLLPINDTTMWHTWLDTYPYRAISIFALHPVYLHLPAVGRLSDKQAMARFEQEAARLNALPTVDYEAVIRLKEEYIRLLFEEKGLSTLDSPSFRHFFKENKVWLVPYAAFCYLRDTLHTPVFSQWGEYARYDADKIARLTDKSSEAYPSIALYYFQQYHLHRQLSQARRYARNHGVVLKGDIPIGVARDSVDTWVTPALFNLDSQTGAPPDDFSTAGQNWGFPTYNWSEMEKDGYAWWKARMTKMSDYFDAYRIDHILGFFRIWEIPDTAVEGLPGHFNAALPFRPEELSHYSFFFNEMRHARPYIRGYMLSEIFGDYADEVRKKYLIAEDTDTFCLKGEVDTQRKISSLLGDSINPGAQKVRDGLFRLVDEVLFVRDPYMQDGWHPRIEGRNTYSFRDLPPDQQWAFLHLHDDFYYSRHNAFWKKEALKKLPPLISSTDMLVCGEDLGMIPQCVPEVMNDLQILSLEIQ
ncbi:MAG: 4-alpha-glucanotransferase, partial [Porphyromonadaceae bacterium]|nr:4-alpha-glucanotransferase [Porphyromonadaceae bacterium]